MAWSRLGHGLITAAGAVMRTAVIALSAGHNLKPAETARLGYEPLRIMTRAQEGPKLTRPGPALLRGNESPGPVAGAGTGDSDWCR